jgi:hypothetical protein
VTDINKPGMDVLSLLQKLQENEILVNRQKPCFVCFAPPRHPEAKSDSYAAGSHQQKPCFFAFLNTYDNFFA